MIMYIHQSGAFIKQYNKILKSGSKGANAVYKADSIIKNLKNNRNDFHSIGRMTRHGEQRLKKCIKYDLGSGYRIIFSILEEHLNIQYMGTHDECHKWLEKRKNTTVHLGFEPMGKGFVEKRTFPEQKKQQKMPCEENNDSFLHIEDKYLRQIFRGLARP